MNERMWRLGMPWIDTGVDAGTHLARVSVYGPGPEAACLECGWEPADYALLEQEYPCGAAAVATPTMAPSGLSAVAAALGALECGFGLVARAERTGLFRQGGPLLDGQTPLYRVQGLAACGLSLRSPLLGRSSPPVAVREDLIRRRASRSRRAGEGHRLRVAAPRSSRA